MAAHHPPPAAPGDARPVLFVGDIHGCRSELERLLEVAGFRPGDHRLLPVGDTINRGPDAPGVLDLLRETGAEPLLGNHELALLALRGRDAPPNWALRSRSAWHQLQAAERWERDMAWVAAWPLFREGPGWIAVHAGLHPTLPPARTDPAFLTEVRFCDAAGRRPEVPERSPTEPPPGFRPWFEHLNGAHAAGRRTVVFGHWARRGLEVGPGWWGLDTGCVYGRQLTGLWWPEGRLVQVPSAQPPRHAR